MTLTPTVLTAYDREAPSGSDTETATFGLGCFWGPDAEFGALDGVVRTRVGYAGGSKADPSYHALGDHTEVFQVDYDPDVLEYRALLDRAFRSHDPDSQTGKRQYQNVVLTATDEQRAVLDAFLAERGFDPDAIGTRIERLSGFHPAEAYHQKYNLRGKRWVTDVFAEAGYDDDQLRESPAAAKLNAHLAGHDVAVPFLNARSES